MPRKQLSYINRCSDVDEFSTEKKLKICTDFKLKVATEAATLLYCGIEKEYKQAKLRAAKNLGEHFLPSNREIATELDRIAEENEGDARKDQLVRMRREALIIMSKLKCYHPILIGSVWRGTSMKMSDIDIIIFYDSPETLPNILETHGLKIFETEWVTVNKRGENETSYHIYTETPCNFPLEIVVRSSEEAEKRRKCDIFGDEIVGVNIQQLTKLIVEDSTRKFIPE